DAGETGGGEDVAFGNGLRFDQFQGFSPQPDFTRSRRFTAQQWLVGNIDHAGLPARVQVSEFLFQINFFQSWITLRICSAAFSLGFTNLGVNHGKVPSKSGVTKICPSQSGPEPMPIVGTGMA